MWDKLLRLDRGKIGPKLLGDHTVDPGGVQEFDLRGGPHDQTGGGVGPKDCAGMRPERQDRRDTAIAPG